MPTYDYLCLDCRRRFEQVLSYAEYGARPVTCSHCGSAKVRRRPPRVRLLRGEEAALESLANPEKLNGLEDDPRAMAKMFREMGKAGGEELPPQFDEIVDRLDAGQSPEQIESALPDLGGADEALPGGE
ncbi:MAG: hypothetical protein OHK0031_09810 [Anaerolineales bacterium]